MVVHGELFYVLHVSFTWLNAKRSEKWRRGRAVFNGNLAFAILAYARFIGS
jgi:hypothetical protein